MLLDKFRLFSSTVTSFARWIGWAERIGWAESRAPITCRYTPFPFALHSRGLTVALNSLYTVRNMEYAFGYRTPPEQALRRSLGIPGTLSKINCERPTRSNPTNIKPNPCNRCLRGSSIVDSNRRQHNIFQKLCHS